MRKLFSDRSGERGAVLVAAALMIVVFVPMMGLIIDGGILYFMKLRLSQACDASALAGARSLNRGDLDQQKANAVGVASRFFDANFPDGFWSTTGRSVTATVSQDDATRVRWVTVAAQADAPLYFMRILGKTSAHLSVTAEARRRDVNILLVVDRSSSMNNAGAIPALKTAAKAFVDKFAEGRDKVGLLVFGGSYIVAYHPATTFKTQVDAQIDGIAGEGNTGSAQALWKAYNELQNLNEPGALNVIVFFTDGLPNGITADFQPLLKPLSTCTDKLTPKVGFLAQWGGDVDPGPTAGVINTLATSVGSANEVKIANSAGCAFAADLTRIREDIARMPDADYWGDATTGYKPVDLTRVDLPTQVVAASINAADNAARRIRSDAALRPYIYTIGLGGTTAEGHDDEFMRRVSNDPQAGNYDPTQSTGLFVWSPSPAQLQDAFQRIASEVLRLSQ
jgi:Flp pilus assembly protein TadG